MESKKIILSVVCGLAVFFLGVRFYSSQVSVQDIPDSVYEDTKAAGIEKMDSIRKQAIKNHPELDEIDAIKIESRAQYNKDLKEMNSKLAKWQHASSVFYGFYSVNVVSRPAYCNSLGVKIDSFVSSFKALHTAEYAMAIEGLKSTKMDYERVLDSFSDTNMQVIADDMALVAEANETNISGACQLLADHAEHFTGFIQFKDSQPEAYANLMAGAK